MSNKGVFNEIITSKVQKLDINSVLNDISDTDLIILGTLLDNYNKNIEGCKSWELLDKLQQAIASPTLNMAIAKLQRIGLIEKENKIDFNNNEYFTFKLTEYGVDICLKNEHKITKLFSPKPKQWFEQ